MTALLRPALLASAAALAVTAPTAAQIAEGSAAADRPVNFIAVGAAYLPDYAGSDDYRAIPFGALRYELGDVVIRSEGPGLAVDLFRSGPLTAGVYGRWSGGRDEVDDAVVALLPEVGSSITAGGFANLQLARNVLTGFDRVSIGARVGADLLGEFDGAAWSASASYATALSQTSFFLLSASVSGYSDDYADTLFSVDAAGAATSGLPVFDAEGGVQDIGLIGLVDVGIGGDWTVTTVLGVSQLLGDFADSPIVSVRGDETQIFTGVALGRRF